MQTKVVFWPILRNDGIRCGLVKQGRFGFWKILQGAGIWCGKTLGHRDGRLALRKGQ